MKNIYLTLIYLVISIFAGLVLAGMVQKPLMIYAFYEIIFLCFICIMIFALLLLPVLNHFTS